MTSTSCIALLKEFSLNKDGYFPVITGCTYPSSVIKRLIIAGITRAVQSLRSF